MTVTPTLLKGPFFPAPGLKMAVYQTALDSAHASGGEPIDLTADFTYVYAILPGGNDTAADNYAAKLDFMLPAPTVAVTSSNILITACWSADGTDGEAFVERTTDPSDIGQFSFTVIGA